MTRRIGSSWQPPAGYREAAIGGTLVVAREDAFDAFVAALGMGTLHAWASTQPGAVGMQGRGTAWATRLPNGEDVVVRHSRHGGMLAPLTRDLFLAPTRAPEELAISARMRAAGIRTPEVVGYAVYSAFGPLCRADVVTARVPAIDLPRALTEASASERTEIAAAVRVLLDSFARANAQHEDLNARNVLVERTGERRVACALDVDRVVFRRVSEGHLVMLNGHRLFMSLLKLQGLQALSLSPADIVSFMNETGSGTYGFSEST